MSAPESIKNVLPEFLSVTNNRKDFVAPPHRVAGRLVFRLLEFAVIWKFAFVSFISKFPMEVANAASLFRF